MHKPLQSLGFIAFFIFLSINSNAQSWRWGRNGGSTDSSGTVVYEGVASICTDVNNNIYALCYVGQANLHWDNLPLTSWGAQDILLVSYSCDGTLRWIKQIGGSGDDEPITLKADTKDGIYIAGTMQTHNTAIHIGNDTSWTSNTGYKTLFLAKYDTAGNYKWLKMPEPDTVSSSTTNVLLDMDVDTTGDAYCMFGLGAGLYNNIYTASGQGFYIFHYASSGSFISGTQLQAGFSSCSSGALYLKRDFNLGRYYVTGGLTNVASLTLGTTAINNDQYIAAFNNSGQLIWIKEGNGSYNGAFARPALDDTHNIYLAGSASNLDTFNGYHFVNTVSTAPYSMPVIVKLDTNGNNKWVKTGSTNFSTGAVAITCSGSVATITGFYYNKLVFAGEDSVFRALGFNTYVASVSKETGMLLHLDTLQYPPAPAMAGVIYPNCLTLDRLNNIYIGGTLSGSLHINNDSLNALNYNAAIAKYGFDNCTCTDAPVANFNLTANLQQIMCTYTGTTNGVDSIVWQFGDGSTATGSTCNHLYMSEGIFDVCVTAYGSCGNSTYCSSADIGVGVKNISGFAGVQVYPNPATNTLFVTHAPAGTTVTLFNILGQAVYCGLIDNSQYSINTSALPTGTYLVQLTDSKGNREVTHVVKE